MLKKRKHPRKLRRIELKVNNVTLVIKHPTKWVVKVENTPPLCFDTPLVPFTFTADIKFDLFDIRNHKGLVQAATGKRLEEIIEEQERIEAQTNAIRRMYNFWVKGEV